MQDKMKKFFKQLFLFLIGLGLVSLPIWLALVTNVYDFDIKHLKSNYIAYGIASSSSVLWGVSFLRSWVEETKEKK